MWGDKMFLAGVDIGGTKCALSIGNADEKGNVEIVFKEKFPTQNPKDTLEKFCELMKNSEEKYPFSAIGISCGGPLDSKRGIVMSPPNLPGWDNVEVVKFFKDKFSVPCALQNDANACAFAEYKFGAGRGYKNIVFLTFGTGLGAGLILDGKLYSGTNDNAGECGHIRLAQSGPLGYGKEGSFEGFCSGGGIARLAQMKVKEKLDAGVEVAFCRDYTELESINAKLVAEYAVKGDELAKSIYNECGRRLGQGLSIIIDLLNPEVIIIGSIFTRSKELLWSECERVLKKEALPLCLDVCKILKSELSENIGDYAALSLALKALEEAK